MADLPISGLPAGTPGLGGPIAIVQAATTKQTTVTAAGASMMEAANAAAQAMLIGFTSGVGTVGALIAAFSTMAAGGILYASALDTPDVLAAGANGEVLTMVAGAPAWAVPSSSFTTPVLLDDGSAAAPSLAFAADTNTGLYRVGNDDLGISTGGVLRLDVSTTAVTSTVPYLAPDGSLTNVAFGFASLPNTGMYKSGASAFALVRSGVSFMSFSSTGINITRDVDLSGSSATSLTWTGTGTRTFGTANSAGTLAIISGGSAALTFSTNTMGTFAVPVVITPGASTGSPQRAFTVNPAAHTALTASTEYTSFFYNTATQQFDTGAIATQRFARISAPTYAFVGASTITDAATLAISGAPIAGTNATITNSYALWIQSGTTRMDGDAYVAGKLTVVGLIDPTGLAFTPVAANPGGGLAASTLWVNTGDSNKLYFGAAEVGGGGGTIGGTVAATQIPFGASLDTLTGEASLTYDTTTNTIITDGYGFTGAATTGMFTSFAPNILLKVGGVTEFDIAAGRIISNVQLQSSVTGAAAPAYSFSSAADLGMFKSGGNLAFSVGGVERVSISTVRVSAGALTIDATVLEAGNGTSSAPSITFASDQNTGIYRVGADNLGISTANVLRWDVSTTAITSTLQNIFPASTTSAASIQLPHGTAPTSPVDGDMWTTTAGLFARINGGTVGPFGTSAPAGADSQVQYNNGGAFGGHAAFTFNDAVGAESLNLLQTADAGNTFGLNAIFGRSTRAPAGSGNGTQTGIRGQADVTGAGFAGNSSTLYGGQFSASTANTAATALILNGIQATASATSSGDAASLAGVRSVVSWGSSGTLTNLYGVYIDTAVSAGTVTNHYGVYQVNADALNYFGGSVEIDGTLAGFLADVVTDAGTSITLSSVHQGRVLRTTAGTAVTITVPNTLPVGFSCTIIQDGAGLVSYIGGATINNRSSHSGSAGQYAAMTIVVLTNAGGSAAVAVLAGDTA